MTRPAERLESDPHDLIRVMPAKEDRPAGLLRVSTAAFSRRPNPAGPPAGRGYAGWVLVGGLAVLAVFAGALARSTFGFGDAVVSMPLLALLPLGLHTGASLVGLAGLTVAALSLLNRSREIEWAGLARLAAGTVAGIPLGIALLRYLPAQAVTAALGGVLVLYGCYGLLPAILRLQAGLAWAYPAGLAAGALGSAYNFSGMPVVVYGTLRGWRPAAFRGTLQAYFLMSGTLVVASQAAGGIWTPAVPWLFAACLPAIALATWCGHLLHRRIPAERFRGSVYLLVLFLGAILLARATGLLP